VTVGVDLFPSLGRRSPLGHCSLCASLFFDILIGILCRTTALLNVPIRLLVVSGPVGHAEAFRCFFQRFVPWSVWIRSSFLVVFEEYRRAEQRPWAFPVCRPNAADCSACFVTSPFFIPLLISWTQSIKHRMGALGFFFFSAPEDKDLPWDYPLRLSRFRWSCRSGARHSAQARSPRLPPFLDHSPPQPLSQRYHLTIHMNHLRSLHPKSWLMR